MALTFLRHLPPLVEKGVCYGMTDLDLAPGWELQADALAERFRDRQHIFTSPLKRCRQIAEKIGDFDLSSDLREMDFGTWEMQLWDVIDRHELDAWADDFFHARPHGGESVAQLQDRVARAVTAIPDGALIVTHNGVIKAAAALAGLPDAWSISLGFGDTLEIEGLAATS